jgi:AcrR family transcriptional regulator
VEERDLGLRDQKKLETWRALREAALQLVAERDYEAITVEDIAASARVAKRTFFNYFDSKEAVFFDPDPAEDQRWSELARARPDDEPIWVSLREFFLAYTAGFGPKLAVEKQLLASSPLLASRMRATSERLQAFVRAWLGTRPGGRDEFRLTLMINTAFTVVNTSFRVWDPDSSLSQFQKLVRQGFAAVDAGMADSVRTTKRKPRPKETNS